MKVLTAFVMKFGTDMIHEMKTKDIFEGNGIELIPSIYANGYAQEIISKNAFAFISNYNIQAVKNHIEEIENEAGDGSLLHSASVKQENRPLLHMNTRCTSQMAPKATMAYEP